MAATIFHSGAATLVGINGASLAGLDRAASLAQLKEATTAGAWPVRLEFQLDTELVGPSQDESGCKFPPALPNYFTGNSRLGTADGRYLCQAFTLKRFLKECLEDRFVCAQMYAAMLGAWHRIEVHEHTLATWRGA
jgi:hypothetical protein